MKKVLFAVICCVAMVYAIVPMNVGNKWWYQCYSKNVNKLTYCVEKDTIIDSIDKKKIKINMINSFGTKNSSLSIWYDTGVKFYIDGKCRYNIKQADTTSSWGDVYLNSSWVIKNDSITFCGIKFISQTERTTNKTFSASRSSDFTLAKNLGIYSESSHSSAPESHGQINLVAAQIDGIFMGDTSIFKTSIDENIINKTNLLISNYPNPFNPSTKISYQLPEMSAVKISVYNTKGELVKNLVNGVMPEGSHTVDFDGSDLNSGVYYYKLKVGNKVITNKMLLVK